MPEENAREKYTIFENRYELDRPLANELFTALTRNTRLTRALYAMAAALSAVFILSLITDGSFTGLAGSILTYFALIFVQRRDKNCRVKKREELWRAAGRESEGVTVTVSESGIRQGALTDGGVFMPFPEVGRILATKNLLILAAPAQKYGDIASGPMAVIKKTPLPWGRRRNSKASCGICTLS